MGFVHLHVHSEYSLLKAAARVDDLVARAKQLGFSALALTDQNVMYGVVPFYKACIEAGIKPIIGIEVDVTTTEKGDRRHKLVLLAKNNQGYEQLMKFASLAQTNEYHEPTLKKEQLIPTKNVIALASFHGGEPQGHLMNGDFQQANECVSNYQSLFGEENVYLEIQPSKTAIEKQLISDLAALSNRTNCLLVASNHVHYVDKGDHVAYECLLAIGEGRQVTDQHREVASLDYLMSESEIEQNLQDVPEACQRSGEIADRCHVTIPFGQEVLPKYPLPMEGSAKEYLQHLCEQGLKKRYSVITEEIRARLNYELSIINDMNYTDYFLIVWDFMNYAHQQGMITGPGRGSAAGSLVAYVLEITNVDPIRYRLLFERFLNPERISMPDIDIDFPDRRREEVIDYVVNKYGHSHVAQIITFGTLAAKAALRDVGRVLGLEQRLIDSAAKQIPSSPGITLSEAVRGNVELKKMISRSEELKRLFQLASKIEGIPRHASTHAAGIVISQDPLTAVVPLQSGHDRVRLTQYPMDVLEELGLVKMDFLGLKNLTLLEQMVTMIEQQTGETVIIQDLPLDDPKTFELLGRGETTGVFQLESAGMRSVLQKLKPNRFEDIVAVNALYRPGPMEHIPDYIEGKHGRRQVTYPHPDLKPILADTYGVIVYQEQIMQIAATMAGFSLGEADLLRRAVSKKKREVLEEERVHFVQGAINKGYEQATAEAVYDLIVRFANYGFNRSHAVAYSVIAYQLAYMKANYPLAFYSSLLTNAIGLDDKISQYVFEAKQQGIPLVAPSINGSQGAFMVKEHSIQFGLAAIKGVGSRAVAEIIQKRTSPYRDLFDFCTRVDLRHVNRRALESLIIAGCFDEFGYHRAQLLATLEEAIEFGQRKQESKSKGELFRSDDDKPIYIDVPPFQHIEMLDYEKSVLGFYLSGHPISEYEEILASYSRSTIAAVKQQTGRSTQRIAGLIDQLKKINTKKGEEMAFAVVSDESAELEVVIFPRSYQAYRNVIKKGELVFIEGKREQQGQALKFFAEKVGAVSQLSAKPERLFLKIEPRHEQEGILLNVQKTLKQFPGTIEVVLYYDHDRQLRRLSDDYRVSGTAACLEQLQRLLGEKNVVLNRG
ncbi:DNA polymerase III subunit alpha [Desertibacillus haloalkaliphilus]|uniref:DNA polymerase III subunit alpha n=1 Tax=Desertibacillus haloalkaliphilus TaxID=1328930 RepID=UPI001C27DB61|nr:DNA polymerase III subunit alpha [Desertibacillus haloalkaliphilus]MBU8905165.1 DNA polymerase III subunit alpha [Desertibacillus haloalkaliphilus]